MQGGHGHAACHAGRLLWGHATAHFIVLRNKQYSVLIPGCSISLFHWFHSLPSGEGRGSQDDETCTLKGPAGKSHEEASVSKEAGFSAAGP